MEEEGWTGIKTTMVDVVLLKGGGGGGERKREKRRCSPMAVLLQTFEWALSQPSNGHQNRRRTAVMRTLWVLRGPSTS